MIGLFLICCQLATATPQPFVCTSSMDDRGNVSPITCQQVAPAQTAISPNSKAQSGPIGNSGQPEINPAESAQTTALPHQ
jgi:hypothetical protein